MIGCYITIALAVQARTQTTSCPSPTTVPFSFERREVVVPATLDGKSGFRLLLDTGAAGGGMINHATIVKLGLKAVGEVQIGDPSGKNRQTAKIYELPELRIGSAEFRNLRIVEEPTLRLKGGGGPEPDGVLGIAAYRDLMLILDFPKRQLTFTPKPMPAAVRSSALVTSPDHGLFTITVNVGGTPWKAHVDTGSGGKITLPKPLADKVSFTDKPTVVGHASTPFNSFDILAATMKGDIVIGGVKLHDPKVEYADIFPAVNIGAGFLSGYTLYIDQRANRMAIVRASKLGKTR